MALAKNILITGGAGFLGSHLADVLVARDNTNVICLDNFIGGTRGNIEHLLTKPNFIFLNHDVTETINLESYSELSRFNIKGQGIQEVYHLACPTSPKNFDTYRIDTLLANSLGVRNTCEVALRYRARLLLVSSSVVYGHRTAETKLAFSETMSGSVDQLSQRACYDEGKRFAETVVATYRDVHKMEVRIARVFRTYGPRLKLRDGQMIPDFILNALDGKPLVIFGNDTFATSLCYVSDIIAGLVRLQQEDKDPGPVNFGSPDDLLVTAVAKQIIAMTGSRSTIEFADPLLFMQPLGLPDISKAKNLLDWLPIVSLEQGLTAMIEYTRAFRSVISQTNG